MLSHPLRRNQPQKTELRDPAKAQTRIIPVIKRLEPFGCDVMMDMALKAQRHPKHSRQGKGMLSNILALSNRTVPGRLERINGSEILRLAFLRRASSSSSTPRRIGSLTERRSRAARLFSLQYKGSGLSTVVRIINTLPYLWLLTKTV